MLSGHKPFCSTSGATIFGLLCGVVADPENVAHMKRIVGKLFGHQ